MTKNPYPFKIPTPDLLENSDVSKLPPEQVLEFIRVESVLRSREVHELYAREDKRKSDDMLFSRFGFGWEVLDGSHHKYLEPSADEREPCSFGDPVYDIKAEILKHPDEKEGRAESWKQEILSCSSDGIDKRMIIQINAGYAPQTILKSLKPLLKERHKKLNEKGHLHVEYPESIFTEPDEHSPFNIGYLPTYQGPGHSLKKKNRDVRKWLKYFRWYDRKYCDGMTSEQITQEDFGIHDTYGSTELKNVAKGIERVRKSIKAAEACNWPPNIR